MRFLRTVFILYESNLSPISSSVWVPFCAFSSAPLPKTWFRFLPLKFDDFGIKHQISCFVISMTMRVKQNFYLPRIKFSKYLCHNATFSFKRKSMEWNWFEINQRNKNQSQRKKTRYLYTCANNVEFWWDAFIWNKHQSQNKKPESEFDIVRTRITRECYAQHARPALAGVNTTHRVNWPPSARDSMTLRPKT